jgi:hypothetical protein
MTLSSNGNNKAVSSQSVAASRLSRHTPGCDSALLTRIVAWAHRILHDPPAPSFWDRRHRRFVLFCVAALLVLSALRVHGFSISKWHGFIDKSPYSEVLVGMPRGIRSDDWAVVLPFFISQSLARPRLPEVNPAIGGGENMILFGNAPVLGPVFLFRPTTWGFALSPDLGMAWMWWSRVLGLLYTTFLVLYIACERRFWLSLLGAVLFLWSPFIQFWSLNSAENIIFGCALFTAWVGLLAARQWWHVALATAALVWAAIALALVLYPPYQIPMAYLALGMGVAETVRRGLRQRTLPWVRLGAATMVTLAAVVTFGIWLCGETAAVLSTITHTVYPGQRLSLGGELPLWQLLGNLALLPSSKLSGTALGNQCEASGFFFQFPLTLTLVALSPSLRRRLIRDPYFVTAAILLLIFLMWALLGLPRPVGHLLLLDRVPATRIQIGVGFLDILLLVLISLEIPVAFELSRTTRRLLGAAWALLIGWCAVELAQRTHDLNLRIVMTSALWVTLGIVLVNRRRVFLPLAAGASLLLTVGFNPITIGGTRYLLSNAMSTAILDVHKRDPGALWAVFEPSPLSHLMPVLGAPCINGVQYYPRLDFWRQFDPMGEHRDTYNRYAHVELDATQSTEPVFATPQADIFRLAVSPLHPGFVRLGVRYFIASSEDPVFVHLAQLEPIASALGSTIYQRRSP